MPKGGPQLAASNTSAVLQFLPKGSHAVAGRLNGPLSTSWTVVVALLWWRPARGCHASRFTTTITITTTRTFRVMSPVSGPESGEGRCRCTDRELVFRRHTRSSHTRLALSARTGFCRASNGDGGPLHGALAGLQRALPECNHALFLIVLFVSFIFVLVLHYALYFLCIIAFGASSFYSFLYITKTYDFVSHVQLVECLFFCLVL